MRITDPALVILRMGSFTSKPKLPAVEQPDLDLTFPTCSPSQLLTRWGHTLLF